jgi:hypothetical protein
MSSHALDALFGLLGGLIPGGIHFAWNITRGTKNTTGTIDLTVTKKTSK